MSNVDFDDTLALSLETKMGVSEDPGQASTYKEHPRFSQYKRGNVPDQKERRIRHLDSQKERRQIYTNMMRNMVEDGWVDDSKMDTHTTVPKSRATSYQRTYRDKLMLSEWLLDLPDDFEENWIMVPCPLGKRMLVLSTRGTTRAFTKSGFCYLTFSSSLPGGNRQGGNKKSGSNCFTMLDCVYDEVKNLFYILDVMSWNGHPVFDSETEFRFYWLHSKMEESSELSQISTVNHKAFVALPNYSCHTSGIQNLLSKPMDFEVDGLLFYHRRTHYEAGQTPLVTWLKAYMVPEILSIPVADVYSDQKPKHYQNFQNHADKIRRKNDEKTNPKKMTKNKKKLEKTEPAATDSEVSSNNTGAGANPNFQQQETFDFIASSTMDYSDILSKPNFGGGHD